MRQAAEPHLTAIGHLVPGWCHHVNVQWDTEEDGSACKIIGRDDYRYGFLILKPAFLNADDALRREYLEHEMIHLSTARIANVFAGTLAAFVPEPSRAFVESQWKVAWEMAVQDTLHLIWRDRAHRSSVEHGRA